MNPAFICLATVIINLTGTWTPDDQKTLDRAQTRCAELYPDSPCLKKFSKQEELMYRAICGEPHPKSLQ